MTDSKPPRSKILLVDDERSIRVTLGEFLRDSDYEVEVAADAAQAKDMLSAENFDVVVTDIVMPRITGVKLLEAIRESSPFVQVILMTGEPTVQTASEAVRAGAFDYLTKPIGREELIKSVANAVQVKTLDDERRRLVEENRQYQENLEQLVELRTKALRESEEKYRGLVEKSIQGLIIAQNHPLRISFASKPMQEITGFSPETLESLEPQELTTLINPEDSDGFFKNFRARINGKKVAQRQVYRIVHKNGDIRWVETYGSLTEYDGSPATQTAFLDITERVQAQDELQKSE